MMIKRAKIAAIAALIGLAGCAERGGNSVANAPPPKPALWKLADADTTIYLFGTVHVLPKNFAWRSPRIEAAIQSADSLVLEIADSGDAAKTAATFTDLAACLAKLNSLAFDGANPTLALVSPLAEGADQIAAERIQVRGPNRKPRVNQASSAAKSPADKTHPAGSFPWTDRRAEPVDRTPPASRTLSLRRFLPAPTFICPERF